MAQDQQDEEIKRIREEFERNLWASGISVWARALTPEEVTKVYNGEDIDE